MSEGIIVLDLDATIIHSREIRKNKQNIDKDSLKGFKKIHNMDNDYIVVERPNLQKFLTFISKKFDKIIVWTAASKEYAEFIIDKCIITKDKKRDVEWYFYSYHCDISEELYSRSKDLRLLYEYFKIPECKKSNTIIIDDYEDVHNANPGKCIHAIPFDSLKPNADKDDFLLKLINYISSGISVNKINDELKK